MCHLFSISLGLSGHSLLNILKLHLLSAYENCYLVEFVELDKVLSEFLFVHKLVQLVIRWMPWLYLQNYFLV